MAARLQWAGILLLAVGVGLLIAVWSPHAGIAAGLIVLGIGVLVYGVAEEREVTNGTSPPAAQP